MKYFSFGLIGWPLSHSMSPQLHQAALAALGLQGEYKLYEVPPFPEGQEAMQDLLSHVRDGRISGLNVTIPHKQNVIPLLDELTHTAGTIGAVNTIFLRDYKLVGDNTDAPGFSGDLKNLMREERGNAVVLGSGGGARAVVYALMNGGWTVTVTDIIADKAQELASDLAPSARNKLSGELGAIPIDKLLSVDFSGVNLIVNCSPVGMAPKVDSSPWPAGLPFPQNAAVYDLVYNPRETRLVCEARAAGLAAQTGLGMLIEQAALAFERWTGESPPRDVMGAAISAD
jgi:shikimate dehydrogenase